MTVDSRLALKEGWKLGNRRREAEGSRLAYGEFGIGRCCLVGVAIYEFGWQLKIGTMAIWHR